MYMRRGLKRHLVSQHSYRYTGDSPNFPVKQPIGDAVSRPVPKAIFQELKEAAIKIWETYDNTYGYVDEKLGTVRSIPNVSDNYGTFIGMFDASNQRKLYDSVGDEAKALIADWTKLP